MKNNIVFLFFFIFFLGNHDVLAKNYYVATNGNDFWSGTNLAQAWKTIQKAANTLNPGDTVYVKAGIYKTNITINVQGNSTSGFITFRNYNNDTVIIDGTGFNVINWTGFLQADGKSYIRIQGFKIQNVFSSGERGASILIHGSTGAHHIEIINNEISNHNGGNGIVCMGTNLSNILIASNNVHHCNTHNLEAIRINSGVTYFKVLNNIVHDNSNIGIDCVGWGVQPAYGLIKNNICYRNGLVAGGAHGIYLDGGTYIVIEDNVCYSNYHGGISVAAEYSGEVAHHNIVRRNIVYHGGVKGITLGGSGSGNGRAQDCAIIHNTIYNNSPLAIYYQQVKINYLKGTNLIYNNVFYDGNTSLGDAIDHTKLGNEGDIISDYNCFYEINALFKHTSGNYTSLSGWQLGTGKDLNSISSNPLFLDVANNNFYLQTNSPCINKGDFLTRTTSSGSGTVIPVKDARFFCDGYNGLFPGDLIMVGSEVVRIISVDYGNNIITVDSSISWNNNDGVSYPYNGIKPDMGAYEYYSSGYYSLLPNPVWISATAIATNQINLLWHNQTNQTGYYLYRSENNNTNSATKIKDVAQNITNYSDVGLKSETIYYYWLKTFNLVYTSGFSSPISQKTLSQTVVNHTNGISFDKSKLRVLPNYIGPNDADEVYIYLGGLTNPETQYKLMIWNIAGEIVKDLGRIDYTLLNKGIKYVLSNKDNKKINAGVYLVVVIGKNEKFMKKLYIGH